MAPEETSSEEFSVLLAQQRQDIEEARALVLSFGRLSPFAYLGAKLKYDELQAKIHAQAMALDRMAGGGRGLSKDKKTVRARLLRNIRELVNGKRHGKGKRRRG
jgi:hypothetical protein